MVPGSKQGLVGGCERATLLLFEATASEGIADLDLVLFCCFGQVVLAIDRCVILGSTSQLEMAGPLVHLLYLSNTIIKNSRIIDLS
jgi:hypothetical protein